MESKLEKEKAINQIKSLITEFDINLKDVFEVNEHVDINNSLTSDSKKNILTKLLYYVGGLLLIAGVIFWIGVNWDYYTDISKVVILIGTPTTLYAMGYLLSKNSTSMNEISTSIVLLASLILPGGLFYTYGYSVNYTDPEYPEYVILSIFSIYTIIVSGLSYKTIFGEILNFFKIISFSIIYYTISYIIDPNGGVYYYSFVSILLGIIYILVAKYFENIKQRLYSSLLITVSLLLTIGGTNIIGTEANLFNVALSLSVAISIVYIYLSILHKSNLILVFSTISFIGNLITLIIELFGEFTSWPILVILSGIIVMACGNYFFKLQQKYIKQVKKA